MSHSRLPCDETEHNTLPQCYDHELSLEGLYSQGMSNLAVLIMSKRIPLDVHKNKDLVFIRSEPAGAMVRVGKDTLINDTPVALSRVAVESKPIVLLKDGYQPFFVKRLPDDYTDVIFVKLKRTIPQIGNVAFKSPIPGGISIVSDYFFSSRRRHTRSAHVSWARRCV